jgi:hypothetical protein
LNVPLDPSLSPPTDPFAAFYPPPELFDEADETPDEDDDDGA